MKTLQLVPAYDRAWAALTKAEIINHWQSNLDFRVRAHSSYVNKQQSNDLVKDGYTHVTVFYGPSQTKFIAIKLEV